MIFPYSVDVPMRRLPVANWALIAITCLISFRFFPLLEGDWDLRILEAGPADPIFYWMIWRQEHFHAIGLLTNLFTHGDIFHLGGNMLFLFVFGNAVNARLGHLQFLVLYFIAGIVASLAWLGLGDGTCCLGASGAISGIVGAFLVLFPNHNISVAYWIFIVRGTHRLPAYIVIGIFVLFDIWGLSTQSAEGGGIAYISHLAGTGLGAASIMALLALGFIKSEPTDRNLLQVFSLAPEPKPAAPVDPYANIHLAYSTTPPANPAPPTPAAAAVPAPAPRTYAPIATRRRYLVVGKNSTSGLALSFYVTALSEADARTQATKTNFTVTKITPV